MADPASTRQGPPEVTHPGPGAGPGASLAGRLRRRISAQGPITFAEFMERALYDPAEGFYARPPVGEHGDFVTSPHVSPAFGALLARQVEDFWRLLGQPRPFDLVEAGAGDGTLAGRILRSLAPDVAEVVRYTAVERSPGARAALAEVEGITVADGLDLVPAGLTGCVLANELLDNLPFHLVQGTDSGVRELLVGLVGGAFTLMQGPVSSDRVRELAPPLAPGEPGIVRPAALEFLDRAAGLLQRGYIWLADYGTPPGPGAPGGAVHGYRGQRVEADVLSDPGSRDITAGVDFDALAGHARAGELRVWGPATQRDVLLALGFRDWDRAAREHQVGLSAARRGVEALRVYSARSRAGLLVDPAGLGGFLVLCLGVGTDAAPLSAVSG